MVAAPAGEDETKGDLLDAEPLSGEQATRDLTSILWGLEISGSDKVSARNPFLAVDKGTSAPCRPQSPEVKVPRSTYAIWDFVSAKPFRAPARPLRVLQIKPISAGKCGAGSFFFHPFPMTSNDRASQLVQASLRDLGAELQKPELVEASPDLRLIGSTSPLDSMALVSLIADLEGRIAAELGKDVVLADESAMSTYRSPFRSVAALTEHVRNLIGDPHS